MFPFRACSRSSTQSYVNPTGSMSLDVDPSKKTKTTTTKIYLPGDPGSVHRKKLSHLAQSSRLRSVPSGKNAFSSGRKQRAHAKERIPRRVCSEYILSNDGRQVSLRRYRTGRQVAHALLYAVVSVGILL